MSERLLEVKDLHTSFFTHLGEVKAIRGVNFYVDKGEAIGIVGESGSGKSVTSLSIMKLLLYPGKITGGEVMFKGENLVNKSNKEMMNIRGSEIAMIFQDPMTSLNPVYTIGNQISEAILKHQKLSKLQADARVEELLEKLNKLDMKDANLDKISEIIIKSQKLDKAEVEALAPSILNMLSVPETSKDALNACTEIFMKKNHVSKEEANERALDMLKLVNIPDPSSRIKNFPHEFSGGMRQRAMIAIALSCEPDLLIADEPTTALDVTIQAQILRLIKDLNRRLNTSTMLITHDLGVVADVCSRIIVMYGGLIMEQGTKRELFYSPRHPYTMGLLKSIPKAVTGEKQRLVPIIGTPPDLLNPPTGCPFYARCKFAMRVCSQQAPPEFVSDNGEHKTACWLLHPEAPRKEEYEKMKGGVRGE